MFMYGPFWAALATLALTVVLSLAQGLGWSRISLPYLLGTCFSKRRQPAMLIGLVLHFLIGMCVALVYWGIFHTFNGATWWGGLLLGSFHGLFVLSTFLQVLPYLHPRMASKHQGPTPTRQLEPPGFAGLNYGRPTPLITWIAHALYGLILGITYAHFPSS